MNIANTLRNIEHTLHTLVPNLQSRLNFHCLYFRDHAEISEKTGIGEGNVQEIWLK